MKVLYIFFFVSCVSIYSVIETSAQTSILPVIGLDILRVNSVEIDGIACNAQTAPGCIEKGFKFNYPFIGLRLEHRLSDKFNFFYQLNYAKRKFKYTSHLHSFNFSVDGDVIHFNHFLNELGVSFRFRNFFIDLGGNYASYRDITFTQIVHGDADDEFSIPINIGHKNYFGYTAGIGYELNRFQLRLAVHQSFRHPENVEWRGVNTDATPTAISLSAGYRFQLLDKIRLGGRKKGCPTF